MPHAPGDRVSIYWPEDRTAYRGTVVSCAGETVQVRYDDGETHNEVESEVEACADAAPSWLAPARAAEWCAAAHFAEPPAARPKPTRKRPRGSSAADAKRAAKLRFPNGLVQVINLDRRPDRLRRMRHTLRQLHDWVRTEAVDGRAMTWEGAAPHLRASALADARWAEKRSVPTICKRTGSFSPHLTLPAVGCALSHRRAWERLASAPPRTEWSLILEDDVSELAEDFETKLERLLAQLPSSWQVVFLGYHESTGQLLPNGQRLRFYELGVDESQTGLFGYLLRRGAAAELLRDRDVFPLKHQIDVQIGMRNWRALSRFALNPEAVLLASPKSEEGACDTDVQTVGEHAPGSRPAHAAARAAKMLVL